MMNKKLKRAALMKEHETMFQCPLCAANMAISELKSLICSVQKSPQFFQMAASRNHFQNDAVIR